MGEVKKTGEVKRAPHWLVGNEVINSRIEMLGSLTMQVSEDAPLSQTNFIAQVATDFQPFAANLIRSAPPGANVKKLKRGLRCLMNAQEQFFESLVVKDRRIVKRKRIEPNPN